MINITIYARLGSALYWTEQVNYTRPVQGEDKLDETLDSAITDFTLQDENTNPPFTEYKVVASDGSNTVTQYFVIASTESEKARMVN